MGCYHPNIIIQNRDKFNPNTNKGYQQELFINSWGEDFKGYEFYDNFNKDPELNNNGQYRAVRVPCYNKCIGCLETTAKEWACRCVLESMYQDEVYMITLTYDDTHLPIKSEIECEGNIFYDDGSWNSYLEYEDAKKFIKALRNQQAYEFGIKGIKYFGCGEYGSEGEFRTGNGRAHFHIIFFGMHIPPKELKVHQINTQGEVTFTCERISKLWDYKGFITVTECNYQVARYVAGYVQKKEIKANKKDQWEYFTHKELYYARRGQTPEKRFMSCHRGLVIGKEFFEEENQKFFEEGYILINGAKQAVLPAQIPRLYTRWLEGISEPMAEKVKENKKAAAERATANKMAQTSLTIKEQLEIEERAKLDKMQILNLRNKATLKES